MAAAVDMGKTIAGECFEHRGGQADQARSTNAPSNIDDVTSPDWLSQHVDSLASSGNMRAGAAGTASNILGSTLTNIASAEYDRDAETGAAVMNAVKSEAEGWAAGKIVSLDGDGGDQPLNAQQRAVVDRLNAERAGTASPQKITPDYDSYLRSRGLSRTDYVPGSEHAEPGGGFNTAAQRHAQMVADNLEIQITARSVEAEAQQAIARGEAVPKGPDMKANTGKKPDVLLGMNSDHMNRVVVFEPKMPTPEAYEAHLGRKPSSDDWSSLEKRRQQRQQQFEQYRDKLNSGKTPYHLDGQKVIHTESGLPIAGDMDVWDIRGAHGEPVPEAVRQEAMRQLMRNPASTVMHREHASWNIAAEDNTRRGADSLRHSNG